MRIRLESFRDASIIHSLTQAAFNRSAYSNHNEARIVEALRDAGVLTLSLVAEEGGEVVGHAAFSPVRINDREGGWFGLGPVSVRPDRQKSGVGSAIIRDGLNRLRSMGARGCVVFGDPAYYVRFGFVADPRLRYAGAPDGYFQRLVFTGEPPTGEVAYEPGFNVA
jgi:putative acetyltransferase